MARLSPVDDSGWPEVNIINGRAVFVGYLLFGVRGLGLLVIAWNTAVLLGGFVPNLETKDFWCLTAITLIQAVGVVDFVLKAKLTEILFRIFRMLRRLFAKFIRPNPYRNKIMRPLYLGTILGYLILLCLLAPVPVVGLYISTGISIWRLIEHNYGNASGSTNLGPSLYALYSLAVVQGVLYGYKTINAIGTRTKLAEFVASHTSVDKELVLAYLDNTVSGCKKDSSFATGRNFVTYAVNLMMQSKSNASFIVGIRVLGQVIQPGRCPRGRLFLAKHLLTRSASFPHLIQRLLETLGPRSPYSKEIREHAASIVALVTGDIHLEQFPRGIQCITSLLLDTSQESELSSHLPKEYERGWLLEKFERDYLVLELERPNPSQGDENNQLLGYAKLAIQGLRILRKLAVDHDNYKIIVNTKDLISMITNAPLISSQLHKDHHDEWLDMVEEALELMRWLMAAPWETETNLLDETSKYRDAIISTLESLLECSICYSLEKRIKSIENLLFLDPSVEISFAMVNGDSRRMFMWILLVIFLLSDNSSIRGSAGAKLLAMPSLRSQGSATTMLQSVGFALGDLTGTLVDAQNNADRVHAAQILEYLCLNCTTDNEYLKRLKKVTVDVMPTVLQEILGFIREIQFVPDTGLGSGDVSQGHGEQKEGSKLREALTSLCWIIWVKWYGEDPDVTPQLDEIAANVCPEEDKPAEKKPAKKFEKLVLEARKLQKKEVIPNGKLSVMRMLRICCNRE
ncbi:hypothetical protein ACP70R_033518 [Stipagrostis hirtigluma subsp. patula]